MQEPELPSIYYVNMGNFLESTMTPKQWIESIGARCKKEIHPAGDFAIYGVDGAYFAPIMAFEDCLPSDLERYTEREFFGNKLRGKEKVIYEFDQKDLADLYDEPHEGGACVLF